MTAAPSSSPTPASRPTWTRHAVNRLHILDAVAVILGTAAAQLFRFEVLKGQENAPGGLSFWWVSLALSALWWVFLGLFGSRELKVLGAGLDEYRRVVRSSLYLFGMAGLTAYLFYWDLPRGFTVAAFFFGLFFVLVGRAWNRRWLVNARRRGDASRRVILMGGPSGVAHLHSTLTSTPEAGYVPVAALLPGHSLASPAGTPDLPLPVLSASTSVAELAGHIEAAGVEAVMMTNGGSLSTRKLRELGWFLADRRISQIMAPALTDIAGPRIHQQPVAGLALIHVSTPRFSRLNQWLKRATDILGSSLILLLLSPVFLAVVLAMKVTDPGPIFFSHRRIGLNGEPFRMHKFRSMVVDAEDRLEALKKEQGAGALLFKMKDDPRVTPLGRFIRRYSIDELPQLWNVLVGDMSLVGPRPQVQAEVDEYEGATFRRLTVKPGMTGLWQVSGRSNLTPDEAIRLDLYYVENWSPLFDVVILARTAKAVVAKDGAY